MILHLLLTRPPVLSLHVYRSGGYSYGKASLIGCGTVVTGRTVIRTFPLKLGACNTPTNTAIGTKYN